ncbi:MAG TPA: HesA/MoeB/ThiF family protein [Verrucomicrobiales bacterium]|nr:HesA/MoeB/ThiF family protein [Verrucomicrobiales bacterium]
MPDPLLPDLTAAERERYAWQLDIPGHGEEGQRKLKAATVLISRAGGVGGAAALQLAAAGIGRLILAHAGALRLDDLNRQLLMRTDGIGQSRMALARETLRQFNPAVEVITFEENVSPNNTERLVSMADIVIDAAPLFEERLALNAASVKLRKPMVEAAMHGMEFSVTVFHPAHPGCLACLCPEPPAWWRRRFPVFGAVSGVAGSIAAVEAIKLITGIGEPLIGRMLAGDLAAGRFRVLNLQQTGCPQCGRTT